MGKTRSPKETATPDPDVQPSGDPAVDDETGEGATEQLGKNEPGPIDGLTPTEQIASPMGGTDNYAYLDQTRTPLHERTQLMDSTTEASQADLNPAFTAQAKDGGPVNDNDESVGTEPNRDELLLAAAENSGQEGAVEQTQAQIDAGAEQQIDAEQVTADADARAEAGKDAADNPTPAGAPSGMEPSSDGEAGTQGSPE